MTSLVSRNTAEKVPVLEAEYARVIARFFQVLADPTRVRLLKALADGEWCVTDLTRALEMDQPAVSHQLKYLRELGLVRFTKTGRHVHYTMADTPLRDILMRGIKQLENV